MNKERRRRLQAVTEQIVCLIDEIEQLKVEEEEAFENMPPALQEGERGDRMQEAINAIDEAVNGMQEAADQLGQAGE